VIVSTLRDGEVIPEGGMTFDEVVYRTTLPDGRVNDSKPARASKDPTGQRFAFGLGRALLPKGTKLERLVRTVTITATPFVVVPEEKTEKSNADRPG
jgi:hypothetical protein